MRASKFDWISTSTERSHWIHPEINWCSFLSLFMPFANVGNDSFQTSNRLFCWLILLTYFALAINPIEMPWPSASARDTMLRNYFIGAAICDVRFALSSAKAVFVFVSLRAITWERSILDVLWANHAMDCHRIYLRVHVQVKGKLNYRTFDKSVNIARLRGCCL